MNLHLFSLCAQQYPYESVPISNNVSQICSTHKGIPDILRSIPKACKYWEYSVSIEGKILAWSYHHKVRTLTFPRKAASASQNLGKRTDFQWTLAGNLSEFSLYGQWRITFDSFLNLLVCQLFGVLGFVIKHSPRMDPGVLGRSSYWVVSTPNAVEGRTPRKISSTNIN